ncbi:L-idonate 5-dehydrogenase [Arthrobacter sp. NicSoilB8]|uniref:L-idonate 5-dehydrogenase n=1 Tax=Arthrobacter sp. NicSoilB8 TaxID=2830998 RepID=UPI001CC67FC2|nr:L-idonate 5-dehydrogenase [Arthrobacter sp. NicSoilB8]BCW71742.1 L-idonate 5-dehydrogenase [Arthrobacter sp. NicSoilB8]
MSSSTARPEPVLPEPVLNFSVLPEPVLPESVLPESVLPESVLPVSGPAVVAHAAGDLRIEDVALAAPGAGEAVVEVAFGGICGSDLHYWLHGAAGESVLRAPMILGHEISGTVVRAAADGSGPGAGTPVAVHPATPGPGAARYPADRPNLSPGCTYLGSAARFPHTDGAFSRYVNLPVRMLRALPASLDLRTAALIEPASVAWHAVARAGDVAGKTALVIGSGPIGALAVAVLKRAGAGRIVAVDMHDRPLEIARAVGADAVLKAGDAGAIAAVEADVVIESSGSHHGLASAVQGASRGGRVVMVGLLPTGPQPVLISLAITRELELVGSFRFNDEIDDVIAALADGSLHIDPVITHTFTLDRGLEAFEVARNSAVSGKVLLDFNPVPA